jgi:hypothetical protein
MDINSKCNLSSNRKYLKNNLLADELTPNFRQLASAEQNTRHFHRLTGVAPRLIRWNAR